MIASTSKACRVQRRRITCRFQIPLRDKTATVSFAKDSVRVHIPGESMDVVLREHQRACETVAVRLVKMAVEALRARKLAQVAATTDDRESTYRDRKTASCG